MMIRILIFLSILIFGCTENPTINVNIDNSGFESHKDFYCNEVCAVWRPPNRIVFDGSGDFVFIFEICKNHPFLSDSTLTDGIDDIFFYFELDDTKKVLIPPMGGRATTEGDNLLIIMNLYETGNIIINEFIKTKDRRLKIKQFKDIISRCKLYAVRPDGKRLDFVYTKETKFDIYKEDWK